MPQYMRKDDRYFVSYITGPSHVWLGLSFGAAGKSPAIIRQARRGQCDHGALDEAQILKAAIAGVAAADVGLHLAEILYCEGDSPRYGLYEHCAKLVAERVASGGEFTPLTNDAA